MTTRKVFSIIGLVLALFLIGNMFLPFLGDSNSSFSFWEYWSEREYTFIDIIVLVELIIAVLFFVLQICGVKKDTKFVYFTLGYYVTYHIGLMFEFSKHDYMQYTQIGFWLGFIVSIVLLIITIIGNLVSNERKAPVAAVSYDSQTGQPINQ
ncbi:MAG: hypothetical protein IKF36_02495 [Bacilli bacterium]|nr:hypothetical protein [Bacilli bacterium]